LHSVEVVVNAALHHVTDDGTAAGISRVIIGPWIETLRENLRSKLDEILEPHLSGHPITYNDVLTKYVHEAQAARSRGNLEIRLTRFFGDLDNKDGDSSLSVDMRALIDTLAEETELDMDTYPCSMAVDTMEAYYQVGTLHP
jgi:hypothetical protein